MKKFKYDKGLYQEWSDQEWEQLQEARGMRETRLLGDSRDDFILQHYKKDLSCREMAELLNSTYGCIAARIKRLRQKGIL